ncbi:winged helix-turn-helix transcriptional regulator [Corynebacterium sp. Marseille-Q2516]
MLTANLRAMEADGLLTRTAPHHPPRVDYQLTELGESLAPVLDAMKKWGSAIPATAHTA